MDHFTTNRQDPGGLPCFVALFSLVPATADIVIYRWGEGSESALFAKDDVPRFYNEVNDLQRQVVVGK